MVNRWKEIAEGMRDVEKHGFPDEEPDLYTVNKVSRCNACDNPAICYFTDLHHPEKPVGFYLCSQHKLLLENVFCKQGSNAYKVRFLE